MRNRMQRLAAGLVAGATIGLLAAQVLVWSASGAGAASWTDANCSGSGWSISTWRRADAQAYAQRADREGYEWGGGCYKLNDRDDTPGAPDSNGEGADCSGFTFKSWGLRNTYGASGFWYWQHEKNVHGPYSTADLYAPPSTAPFRTLPDKSYATTAYMDAFVYRTSAGGHVGMIYQEGSSGSDYIVEAKSDDIGTRISYTTYRSQSAYRAIQRRDWTPDCYPKCA